MRAVHVIHENPDWFPPFAAAFEAEQVPYVEWLLDGRGAIDLDGEPPDGVYWSRMSASAHTRGHPLAKEHTRAVLSWLHAHGRRVVNGRRVLELEMSKVDQLTALRRAGIDVPRTVAVVGADRLVERAADLPFPLVLKHNQGGKGLGVHLFDSHAALAAHVTSPDHVEPVDGISLLQEYVAPAEPFVTRVELVGATFVYAIRASTAHGFELCPADACAPTGELFELRKDYTPPLLPAYREFMAREGVGIAGIEYVETADGRLVTYDVNTNTNYNPGVEAQAQRSGPREIARYLKGLLAEG